MKSVFTILCLTLSLVIRAQQSPLDTTVLSPEEKVAAGRLEAYRQRVLKGENMSVLAALYSEDKGSVKTGGRYDGIVRGQFVPEFEKVAFSLKPGEVSEVFATQYGFHFIQLVAAYEDKVDLRHMLVTTKTNSK